MSRYRLSLSNVPLLIPACCMAAGIVIGRQWALHVPWLAVFAISVAITLFLWRWARLQTVLLMGCFVVLGIVLATHHKRQLQVTWPDDEVNYEAVVISEPIEKPRSMAVDLLLTASSRRIKAYFALDTLSRRLHPGDGLLIYSRIKQNSTWRRGTFDYQRYLEIHGFTGTTYVPARQWQWKAVSLSNVSRLQRAKVRFLKWRSLLLQRLRNASLEEDEYAVVAAMALGDKSALTKELREVYNISGASHVLALSGLHLGIIFGLLSLLTMGRRLRTLMVLTAVPALWAFVLLVGMPPSVVRSAVMLSLYSLLSLAGRNRQPLGVLAFTAIVMLIANPWTLFDVGFQFSFMAMLAILTVVPLLDSLLSARMLQRHPFMRMLWGLAAVSIAAQTGVAPLVAYYFGRFSTYFLLTNFIVIPAATLVLYLSLATLIIPPVAWLLSMVVDWLNTVLTWVSSLPYASIDGLHPTPLQTVAVYVLITSLTAIVLRLSLRFARRYP